MSKPNVGDKVSIRLHFRANGKVGGWTPVDRVGTVVKVNRVTAVVECDGWTDPETVTFERITILAEGPALRPQCAICQSSHKAPGRRDTATPRNNPCFAEPTTRWPPEPYAPVKGDARTIEITCGKFSHVRSITAR